MNAEEVAVLVGYSVHDIPVLVRAGLLKPLGAPAPNAIKYFTSSDIEEKVSDPKWGAGVTYCLYKHWRDRRHPSTE